MMFPELRRLAKRFLPDFGEPISLGLKGPNITFDATLGGGDPNWYERNGFIFNGGSSASWSGETVSRDAALSCPTIYACNQLISGTIGYIPATLRQAKNGASRDATEHPMYSRMHDAPNEEMTAQTFRELLTSYCLLEGDAFGQVIRRSGTGVAMEIRHLLPGQVKTDREKGSQKRLVYKILNEHGATDKTYTVQPGKPQDILHLRGLGWDGIRGYSVLHKVRHSIGMAIAADRNVSAFWSNGGRGPYLLEMPKKFADKTDADKFRADWMERMRDPHNPPILDQGMVYKPIGSSMRDAQAIEFRQAIIAELCRPFDVQPHLVGDLSRATFNNIEELALQFEKITLSKWLKRWQQEFWRCVLSPDEKEAGYYLHQNLDALRRGDFTKRMEGYASALQNGHLNIDEVRELEDRNPLPNGAGSHNHIQINMGTLSKDGAVQPASSLVRLN